VQTRLEQWEAAETLLRALIERYPSERPRWAIWCLRTAHGDRKAALQAAAPAVEEISASNSDQDWIDAVLLDVSTSNDQRAYARMTDLARRHKRPHLCWLAFALADRQGADDVRLEMVKAAGRARGNNPGRMQG
jgi:hypothetical protein